MVTAKSASEREGYFSGKEVCPWRITGLTQAGTCKLATSTGGSASGSSSTSASALWLLRREGSAQAGGSSSGHSSKVVCQEYTVPRRCTDPAPITIPEENTSMARSSPRLV